MEVGIPRHANWAPYRNPVENIPHIIYRPRAATYTPTPDPNALFYNAGHNVPPLPLPVPAPTPVPNYGSQPQHAYRPVYHNNMLPPPPNYGNIPQYYPSQPTRPMYRARAATTGYIPPHAMYQPGMRPYDMPEYPYLHPDMAGLNGEPPVKTRVRPSSNRPYDSGASQKSRQSTSRRGSMSSASGLDAGRGSEHGSPASRHGDRRSLSAHRSINNSSEGVNKSNKDDNTKEETAPPAVPPKPPRSHKRYSEPVIPTAQRVPRGRSREKKELSSTRRPSTGEVVTQAIPRGEDTRSRPSTADRLKNLQSSTKDAELSSGGEKSNRSTKSRTAEQFARYIRQPLREANLPNFTRARRTSESRSKPVRESSPTREADEGRGRRNWFLSRLPARNERDPAAKPKTKPTRPASAQDRPFAPTGNVNTNNINTNAQRSIFGRFVKDRGSGSSSGEGWFAGRARALSRTGETWRSRLSRSPTRNRGTNGVATTVPAADPAPVAKPPSPSPTTEERSKRHSSQSDRRVSAERREEAVQYVIRPSQEGGLVEVTVGSEDSSRRREERLETSDRPIRSDKQKRRATISAPPRDSDDSGRERSSRRDSEREGSSSASGSGTSAGSKSKKPRRLSRSPLGRSNRYRDEDVSSNTEFNKRNLKLVPERTQPVNYVQHHVQSDQPYPLYPNPSASTHEHDPVEMVGPGGHAPTHRRRSNSGGSGLPPLPPLQPALRPLGSHPSHILAGQRRGWFNRRGDELVDLGKVKIEERPEKQYPSHLQYHPEVGKGYQDSYGNIIDINGRITRRIG